MHTWISLNKLVLIQDPVDAMHFGQTLPCILQRIIGEDPEFGPVLLSKVDLDDAYILLWIWK